MQLKKTRFLSVLLGGMFIVENASLRASTVYASYPLGYGVFDVSLEAPRSICRPAKIAPAFKPLPYENRLEGRDLIRIYGAPTPASGPSPFEDALRATHCLDLTDQDFTQNSAVWDALRKSDMLAGLRTLDVSRSGINPDADVNPFLSAFMENPSLNSLCKIKAANTNISLETLQKIKAMKPVPYFVRDMEQFSSRFEKSVVVMEVDMSGSPLLKSHWQELREIEKPEKEVDVCYRAYPFETAKAYLKLEIES